MAEKHFVKFDPAAQKIKTCSSCTHRLTQDKLAWGGVSITQQTCQHQENKITEVDIISGEAHYLFINCYAARTTDGACGIDAKWHAPIAPQPSHSVEAPKPSDKTDNAPKSRERKYVIGVDL